MRRALRAAVILTLAWQFAPGAAELVEGAWHQLLSGHGAHARTDAAHQPDEPEHACTGVFHMCGCHSTRTFNPPDGITAVGETHVASASRITTLGHLLAGVHSRIERPPRA